MSGLAGLWNRSGQPVDQAIVGSMAAVIERRGRDHAGRWSLGPVSFACQLLRVTPESVAAAERQPVTDLAGNTLLFDGRLDNREELLGAMSAARCTSESPDSDVVLAAWREWGDASLARLQGEFALAVFDSARQALVLARDPVGCRPLYYCVTERSLIFASEIKAILAHPDVGAEPNRDLIADSLLLPQLPYEDDGETYFLRIRAVLPGERIDVTPSRVKSQRYWDFDPSVQLRYRSYEEYATHLRALMIQAVKRRLRTAQPVAVSFSGGLDSSVVLCIADDLRRNGRQCALVPASYAPVEDPTTEENRFIHLVESARGLAVCRLPMGVPGEAQQLAGAAWHSETPLFNGGWCAETPLLAMANSQGARVLLTGLWSDQLFFVMGYLADLFTRLAWFDIHTHLKEYRNWFVQTDASYFRARLVRELLLNLTPRVLRSKLRTFRTAIVKPRHRGLVSGQLEARVRRRRSQHRLPRFATAHARNIYQFVRAKSRRLQFEADEKMAACYGIERTTPFLDRDVLAFLMSIPGDIQTHDGVPRALLRDAMRGIVPPPILRRRWAEEGTTSMTLANRRREAYAAAGISLHACQELGFCVDSGPAGLDSLDFIALEFWSRAFFSGRLSQPDEIQEGGRR
jgi:asparagine synthase (glutamine-hydrolysing)